MVIRNGQSEKSESLLINKVFSFRSHDAPVYSLEAVGENGFFSGGGDRIVSLRDTSENSEAKGIVNTGSTIYSLKYISEKNILLAGVSGGGMHVIDLNAKKEIHFLLFHQNGIFDIKYSAKHNTIFTAGGDGNIASWSMNDFSFQKKHFLCNGKVRALAINENEDLLAAGCGDGTIRIISLPDFEEIRNFKAHEQSVSSICFHPEKNILLSGGRDAHLNIWDAKNYDLIESIPAHNYAIYSISFSPDGRMFATGSRDKTIKIWDAGTFSFISRIDHEKNKGHIHSVNKVLWIGGVLISGGDDRMIFGWEVKTL